MLPWLSSRRSWDRKASDLYGAVVAQARQPAFYAECGISDTPEGRYEMIVLHLCLVLGRLGEGGLPKTGDRGQLSQRLVEVFIADMDDSMREMGVGDLSVPKKVKRAAGAILERGAAYKAALAADARGDLETALLERLPGLASVSGAAGRLAVYVRGSAAHLAAIGTHELLAGRVSFPAAQLQD